MYPLLMIKLIITETVAMGDIYVRIYSRRRPIKTLECISMTPDAEVYCYTGWNFSLLLKELIYIFYLPFKSQLPSILSKLTHLRRMGFPTLRLIIWVSPLSLLGESGVFFVSFLFHFSMALL